MDYQNEYVQLKPVNMHIICNIKKKDLNLIMDLVLYECKLDVFGYNKVNEEYWGKVLNKCEFILYVDDGKLSLHTKYDYSKEVYNICIKITEIINMFEESINSI